MTTDPYEATFSKSHPPIPAAGLYKLNIERQRAILAEREIRQTAEEYASLHYVRDTTSWLIAWAAFEAGRKE